MSILKFPGYVIVLGALVGILMSPAPARAGEEAEALARAVELFEQADYITAQEILVSIDRSKLDTQQQAVRDDYLERVGVALNMAEKAMRDLEDAKLALEEAADAGPDEANKERAQAKQRLEAVLANEYAHQVVRESAAALLRELGDGEVTPPEPPPTAPAAAAASTPAAEPVAAEPMSPEDVERARTLTAEGDAMLRAARYDEAERLYDEALKVVAGFPEAVEGLARLAQYRETISGSRGQSLIEELRARDAINWQRSEAEYRSAERLIREHVEAERFEEAHQILHRARQVVESGKQFADPITKYEGLKSELDSLADYVWQCQRTYEERKVVEIRREIEAQRTARKIEIEDNRRRQVEALMRQAEQHRKDGDLDAAIKVIEQVVVIDPKNQAARWRQNDLETLRTYRLQRELRDQLTKQTQSVLIDVEKSKIPWYEEIRYPKNWMEIISRPERNQAGFSRPDSLLLSALDQPIQVDFRHEPFNQVIEMLASAHKLNILVNWNDLRIAGVKPDVSIDLRLPNEITLKKALTEVLSQAGAGATDLGYEVADGVLTVATQQLLDQHTYAAVYDINDLLMEIPNFTDAPQTDLNHGRTRGTPTPSVFPDFPARYGDDDDDEPEYDPDRDRRVRKVIDFIQETVAPDSWRDNGGTIGVIKEINGQLVVTQNSAAQHQIGNLLGKLREQRAIQIGVEARFITVSSHYLEEMGMDLDILFNAGSAGYDYVPTGDATQPYMQDPVLGNKMLLPRSFSRMGFTPNTPANMGTALTTDVDLNQPWLNPVLIPPRGGASGSRGTSVPLSSSLLGFTNPQRMASDIPGTWAGQSVGPALSIFGSFLDNIQVDLLIRATQADSRSSVLTAPRLVLFNGQRAWVAVTVQSNYVGTLTPTVNVGAAAQAPQTDTISAGAVLDVQATVTADKRYVTMTLRPGVTRLTAMERFQTSGGGTAGDAFVQLPVLSSQRIKTTVSVPDGGTLLIGGQKLASETEVDAGVPILSKIPFLKRAYSARTLVKDEQTLLILIKPTIYITSEQEEMAFPSFGRG